MGAPNLEVSWVALLLLVVVVVVALRLMMFLAAGVLQTRAGPLSLSLRIGRTDHVTHVKQAFSLPTYAKPVHSVFVA